MASHNQKHISEENNKNIADSYKEIIHIKKETEEKSVVPNNENHGNFKAINLTNQMSPENKVSGKFACVELFFCTCIYTVYLLEFRSVAIFL